MRSHSHQDRDHLCLPLAGRSIRVDYERFATADEMAEVIKREDLDANFMRQATRFDPNR